MQGSEPKAKWGRLLRARSAPCDKRGWHCIRPAYQRKVRSPLTLAAQDWLLDVLRGNRLHMLGRFNIGSTTGYEACVSQKRASIGFEGGDFRFIVGRNGFDPLQPALPTPGHR